MQNSFKSLVVLLALAALPAGPATAAEEPAATNAAAPAKAALKPSDLFADTLVAKGKGVEIKRSKFDDALISLKASFAARGQTLSPDQSAALEAGVLDNLIQMQLLLAKASEADKTRGKEDSVKRFEMVRTNAGSEEALSRQLKAVGLTAEELRKNWADDTTARAVLERELNVNITDGDIKKFYDDNPAKFEEPEMVHVSHILLGTRDAASQTELSADEKAAKRKQAEALLKRARAGEDFTALAKQYSEDPGVKQNNGEYTFPHASADPRRAMVTEFEIAAFALQTNEISDIVTTQYGYHIIKLIEKIPAQKVELAKISSKVKDFLVQEALKNQAPEYLAKLKKDADVEILDPKLRERYTSMALPAGHPPLKAGTNNTETK
jgi:peptidyl-prolyl cis-trans isomerase C